MAQFKVKTHTGKIIELNDKNQIHQGGEGKILLIDSMPDKVAKIYHQGIKPIDKTHFDALQKLDKNIFIIPQELLYVQNDIVGYTMEYAGHNFFALASCFNKNFCQKNSCDQKIKLKIAQSLINAVKIAHQNNIVIGDLNQYNILVNLKGEIRLIDTDSYKIPGYSHSGLLLEEIRDYLYNGIVSKNSDYFALSVLVFYLFTYTHPFKGIHKKYKKLSERMIHKIPVFANDSDLNAPKCYSPLQNNNLQQSFHRLYIKGERFLLNLSGQVLTTALPAQIVVKHLDEKELSIRSVIDNAHILNVAFETTGGYVETQDRFIVYNATYKAQLNRRFDILKNKVDKVFVSGKNILTIKDDTMYHYRKTNDIVKLTNIQVEKGMNFHQFSNILLMIGNNKMYKIYMDEILNTSVKNQRIEVFSESFMHNPALIQNAGGVQRIFYNTGKDIATVKTGKNIKALYQPANTGIVQYIENNRLENRYFKIKGLKIEYANEISETFTQFAFMPTEKSEGYIFEPTDTGISVIRTQDFKVISKMETSAISSQTSLFYTKSGIVAWEGNSVYLINKKEE